MRRATWTATLLAALLATSAQLLSCGVRCEVPRCDIRAHGCQEQVRDATVCIRGGARPDVDIVFVEASEHVAQELDALAEQSDDELADSRGFYRGLALLGLLPEGFEPSDGVEARVAEVGAFYDSEARQVTVLDRGYGEGAVPLLVHELVHAMQDAEHDLASLEAEGVDAQQGLAAVVEGEAALYEAHAWAYQSGFELDEVEWHTFVEEYQRDAELRAVEAKAGYFALRPSFVYPFGHAYALQALAEGGRDAVAGMLDAPPVSAREVMLGYGAEPPGGEPWVDPQLEDVAVPVLPEGYRLARSTRLGAFGLRVMLRRASVDVHTEFVEQLRGDALSVFVTQDETTVVTVHRLVFATERAARAAEDGFLQAMPELAAVLRQESTLIVLGHQGAWDEPEVQTADWGPVPEDDPDASEGMGIASASGIPIALLPR